METDGLLKTCHARAKANVGHGIFEDSCGTWRIAGQPEQTRCQTFSVEASRAESDDRILKGKRIRDTTEVGTDSNVGPHFAFGLPCAVPHYPKVYVSLLPIHRRGSSVLYDEDREGSHHG